MSLTPQPTPSVQPSSAVPLSSGEVPASRLFHWACAAADRLSELVQNYQLPVLALLSILYFWQTCDLAARRPIWYDEFFTYRISQVPTLAALWAALADGVDLNPPGHYLIIRGFMALFGNSLFVARLPAILAFWVLGLCLYRFVSLRTSALYGLAAVLLVMTTRTYSQYAIEARPYGVVLACCGIALVCWQEAVAGRRRPWSVLGFYLSLTLAISCHYYAVLLLVPFGLAELVRLAQRRRLDIPLAGALLAAPLVLIAFIPLLQAVTEYQTTFTDRPFWPKAHKFFWDQISWTEQDLSTMVDYATAPWPLLLGGLAVALLLPWPRQRRRPRPEGVPLSEGVLVVALTALPVFAVLLGKLITHVYFHRYVLPATAGAASLACLALYRHSRGNAMPACYIVLVLLAILGLRSFVDKDWFNSQLQELRNAARMVEKLADKKGPIVVANEDTFVKLVHHAPESLARRLVYLSDRQLCLRHMEYDTIQRAMDTLCRWTPLAVEDYQSFVTAHPRFQAYIFRQPGWLTMALLEEKASIQLKGSTKFIEVAMPDALARPQPVAAGEKEENNPPGSGS